MKRKRVSSLQSLLVRNVIEACDSRAELFELLRACRKRIGALGAEERNRRKTQAEQCRALEAFFRDAGHDVETGDIEEIFLRLENRTESLVGWKTRNGSICQANVHWSLRSITTLTPLPAALIFDKNLYSMILEGLGPFCEVDVQTPPDGDAE